MSHCRVENQCISRLWLVGINHIFSITGLIVSLFLVVKSRRATNKVFIQIYHESLDAWND
jgi:hypothetical protein